MITTSISILMDNSQAKTVFGPTVDDTSTIKEILKNQYNTVEKINELIDNGDILKLTESIETTEFNSSSSPRISDLDEQESQIIISKINFVFLSDHWTYRIDDEDGYSSF